MICPRCNRAFNLDHASGLCSYCRPVIRLKVNRSRLNMECKAGKRLEDGGRGDMRYQVVVKLGNKPLVAAVVGSEKAANELVEMSLGRVNGLRVSVHGVRT